jgi:penicillin-binding protein 2
MNRQKVTRIASLLLAITFFATSTLQGVEARSHRKSRRRSTARTTSGVTVKKAFTTSSTTARFTPSVAHTSLRSRTTTPGRFIAGGPWREPTFADSTGGDLLEGEDLQVRKAAVDALGPYNGTVVAVDPQTGRILTIVNQKLAMRSGFQPCSTIKVVAALAALTESIVERNTMVRVVGRQSMNLTEALARSNNAYFAALGVKLGFDRVSYYARLFGLGEKAGLNIDGEQPGILPSSPPEAGLGMMTSFGSGISLTPLELASLLSSIANGGTLYYLQYPRTAQELANFVPRVKRNLDIQQAIPEVRPGMMGAVEFGTARRIGFDPNEPIFGKTGTCTDSRSPTHLGWFGSFNDVGRNKLVVVVLLTGGKPVSGPVAAGVAGNVYKNLSNQNFFAEARPISPNMLVSTACCR